MEEHQQPSALHGQSDERVRSIFHPKSIAVLGASRNLRNLGRQVLENLRRAGFAGSIYPINPNASDISGLKAYAHVAEVGAPIDVAIIALPAPQVTRAVDECAAVGIRSVVIISAGFREIGEEGARREAALADALQRHGVRAIGPNCMGVLNAHPEHRLNATFSSATVPHGNVALVSQSGAMGIAVLNLARDLGLGMSYFASLGNKTNISTNDLLIEWEDDPHVGVILLYLENFGNPRRFLQLARRITRNKPIIAIKSGRTTAGATAARSHTGALAEADTAAEALFQQAGVIRAHTVEELFEYARAFSTSPLPMGPRVAIVTNSGGPGILAADALQEHGLTLATLSDDTRRVLASLLPEGVTPTNPLDLIAGANAHGYGSAIQALARDENVDSILVIYTPPIPQDEADVIEAVVKSRPPDKPLLTCVLGRNTQSATFRSLAEASVPTYAFPESAVRSLAALFAYKGRRDRAASAIPTFDDADITAARAIVAAALQDHREWLDPAEAMGMLAAYGIPTAPTHVVRTADGAVALWREMGRAVALKAHAPNLIHKSEAKAIRLNLNDEDGIRAAHESIVHDATRAGHPPTGIIVQEMVERGREIILGMSADPKFGPILMFGLGGIYVEILKDVSFRLAPLTPNDAHAMMTSIRAAALLDGARGEPPADKGAIHDALLRLSTLTMAHPEIREIDMNPFIVRSEGLGGAVADARIRLWPNGEAPRAATVVPEIATTTRLAPAPLATKHAAESPVCE